MNKAIHGALRRDLTRFLDALAAFPDADSARARQLGVAWANFHDQLTTHHEGEHEIAWPALTQVGVSAEVLAQMDAEHDILAAALATAAAAMKTLEGKPSSASAAAARGAISELRTVIETHFEHEERELDPVYLSKKDDPVIKAMGRKFGKVSPMVGGRFFAWVTNGASADELAAIKGNVPPPVLAIIGGIFGRGYRRNVASVWR